jgi:hypothetical protein
MAEALADAYIECAFVLRVDTEPPPPPPPIWDIDTEPPLADALLDVETDAPELTWCSRIRRAHAVRV